MSVAAESPSPSLSSLSEDDDFADILDAELELASAADSASPGEPPGSPSDDEEEEEDEEEDLVVELDAVGQGSNKWRRVEEHHQDQGTATRPEEDAIGSVKDAEIKICPPHPGYFGGLCFRCGKGQDEEDVPGVAFGYIHKGLRLGTSEMDRLRGSEVKNLLRERKLVLILDLDHTLINSTRLHDISAAEMDLGIQSAASKSKS
ncbi:unnamed protein product [Triticum turgidum subsp. durum]|nr:unnamed protein product [Triticum turgidum subsp. durum]